MRVCSVYTGSEVSVERSSSLEPEQFYVDNKYHLYIQQSQCCHLHSSKGKPQQSPCMRLPANSKVLLYVA